MQVGGTSERAVGGSIAAVFQPNAPGRREMSSFSGLRARQLLKGRGQYLSERIRVTVSDHEVVVTSLGPFGWPFRRIGEWPSSDLLGISVSPVGVREPTWPALVLVDLPRLEIIADLRAVRPGSAEREVVRRLDASPGVVSAPHRT